MYLQGDLQAVFDALYTIGAIDPVLKMDWDVVASEMEKNPAKVREACSIVNECRGDVALLISKLSMMDEKSVNFVALEVAREFCEFQECKTLH
ncbi:MAG: cytochrome [Bdellovibrionaceae bacterium]|nr:cytochrome [Pseudobdellovibrionaceae bacterium]